jgi:hypothetical protein
VGKSCFDDDVAAFDLAVLGKTLSQGLEEGVWASVGDYADSWEFGLLLRAHDLMSSTRRTDGKRN